MSSSDSLTAMFSKRYTVALILIGLLITGSYCILSHQQQAQQNNSQIINTAGEQRMLSQRIALITMQLSSLSNSNSQNRSTLEKSLQSAAHKMLSNHAYLKSQLSLFDKNTQNQMQSLYMGQSHLEKVMRDYTKLAILLSRPGPPKIEHLASFENIDSNELLLQLNSAVSIFEQGVKQQQAHSQYVLFSLWSTALILLLSLSLFIFKPMRKWLIDAYQQKNLEQRRVKDFQLALNKHSVVALVDHNGTIIYANHMFNHYYGYTEQEVLGQSIQILRSHHHSNAFYDDITHAINQKTLWRGEICNKAKGGHKYWFSTTIVPLQHAQDKDYSSIIIQNDISEQKQTEFALTHLHQITSDSQASLDDKISRLLKLGRDAFQLPLGLVSEINEPQNIYRVLHASTPNNEINSGDQFEFLDTYCYHTLYANTVVAYHHVGQSDIAHHPCYQNFALESYLGCPLFVDGKRMGTLNFSSPEASPHPFTDSDRKLIQLIAHWIGHEYSRAKQQEQLLSQKQLMEQMSQQARVGAWEVDLINNKIYWSNMTKIIHEVAEDFIPELDTAINFYKAGESRTRITELVERAIATGEPYQEVLQLVTAKGKEIWVEAIGQSDFQEGHCTRLFGSFQDITEQINAQQALSHSRDRLEFVLNATGVGIWDWEIESGHVTFNERWANIVGYTLKELEPVSIETWMSLAHPDDLKNSEHQLNNYWNKESKRYVCESRMRHKLGHWVWVLDTGKVVEWHADGRPKRMIGTHLDISDSKIAELEIQDKNARMALAADSAGIGIWDYNVITQELNWDDWMFKLYGLEASEFIGAYEAWENGLHPEDKTRSTQALQHALATNSKFDTEFRIITPSGAIRHIKASAINKLDAHGQVSNMIGVNYDITDRVEYEQALTKAKTDAETAVVAKSEFLASMSHEIRTPMNGVLGMLDLLRTSTLNDEQSHQIDIAKSSAQSLLNLINDILDFSKIDADKLELESIPFDLSLLLGELCESFSIHSEEKGLELLLDTVEVDQPYLNGDPGRIRQIVSNLIGNALKFTHSGEIVVKASLSSNQDSELLLTLCIKDTGIGIAKDKQKQIFEVFSQADSSTTRHYGGTGLGLAIVKKLCQRMGGDITLSSELGVGSEFTCHLKVSEAPQPVNNLPKVDLSQLNILIVDDNTTNREILLKQLQRWGVKASAAYDADKALELCRTADKRAQFDIAILDMQMPEVDGAQLAQQLRADESLAHIKLIMMTSMQSRGDAKYFANLGFSAYFPKPATASDLFAALHIIADDGQHLAAAKPLVTHHYINEIVKQNPHVIEVDATELPKLNILLVEDNPINQVVAKGILKQLNQSCELAENGQQAIDKLVSANNPYDLIFMDVQMPVMDGLQATHAIRQGLGGAQHENTIIIAMTANAMHGDKEKCLESGMDEYISKPIDLTAIKNKLLHFFGHHDNEFV